MGVIVFALDFYFAAMLSISGLSKVNDSEYFATTLRQQHIVPVWSVGIATKILPWIEILVAILLVTGAIAMITAVIVLVLFIFFLGLKVFLLRTGWAEDCGCYGNAKSQKIDVVSITVSFILTLLAIMYLWLATHTAPVSWIWRLIGGIILTGVDCFLLWKIVQKHRLLSATYGLTSTSIGGFNRGIQAPSFSALNQDGNMVCLDDFRGKRRILMFISPGCPVCPKALMALDSMLRDEQDFVALVIGGSNRDLNHAYAIEHKIHIPLLTPDSDWAEKLYHVRSSPIAFIVDEAGVIRAGGVVNSIEHLRELQIIADTPESVHH